MIYITRQGEMLDQICARRYGTEHGTTEDVLAANPGLAALGPLLPPALAIALPDVPKPSKRAAPPVNLWD